MALVEFDNYGLGQRQSNIGRKVLLTDEGHAVGTITTDVLEWPEDPDALAFLFTTNTGATASTVWTLEASPDNTNFIPINTGTLTGGVSASITDLVPGTSKTGVVLFNVPWHYYRFSLTTSTATHTFGITAFFKDY